VVEEAPRASLVVVAGGIAADKNFQYACRPKQHNHIDQHRQDSDKTTPDEAWEGNRIP